MNKKRLLLLLLVVVPVSIVAQELKVKSFTHDEMNLEARLDGGRTDLNGKQCVLVKVMVLDDIVDCEGGNVGEIITKGTVKKIFVSPSARYIKLEFKYHYPLKITFEDYGYKSLTESATYEVSIVDANPSVQPSNQLQANSAAQQTPHQQVTAPQQSQFQSVQHLDGYSNILPITVNGVTFNMIKVDGGTFTMGATSEMTEPFEWEKPTHQVTLSSYYIGETEVTQVLWKAIMGKKPSYYKGDNLPVERVSWNDCQKFIEKLNSLTGKRFRLPTETEWEFAARGGNKSNGTQYSGSSNIDEVAWYWQNSGDKYIEGDWNVKKIVKNKCKTHPVKSKKANELGIYDMSGNVMEWCQDRYGSYESNVQVNPIGPTSGTNRICRGGSWIEIAGGCRSSNRFSLQPDKRRINIGLRLVLSE